MWLTPTVLGVATKPRAAVCFLRGPSRPPEFGLAAFFMGVRVSSFGWECTHRKVIGAYR